MKVISINNGILGKYWNNTMLLQKAPMGAGLKNTDLYDLNFKVCTS